MSAGVRASRRRAAVALLAIGACAAVLAWPRPMLTDAAYTDAEYVASGTMSAGSLSNPTNMTCTPTKALGIITGVTITWQSAYPLTPTTVPTSKLTSNPAGYTTTISPSGTGPFTYTMTLNEGLLGGILGNALGSTVTFTVVNQAGANWQSASLTRTLTTGALGLNPKCA